MNPPRILPPVWTQLHGVLFGPPPSSAADRNLLADIRLVCLESGCLGSIYECIDDLALMPVCLSGSFCPSISDIVRNLISTAFCEQLPEPTHF
jgi:hypothetical protein